MNITEHQKIEILCAYLPYGIEVQIKKRVAGISIKRVLQLNPDSISSILPFNAQPILRHRDDMTDEELLCLANNWGGGFGKSILANDTPMYLCHAIECLQYLHSIHIDTFGAIEAGFALRKAIKP
jgi:hypothetical protein